MLEKLTRSLTEDISPLLPAGIRFRESDAIHAFERVWIELIAGSEGRGGSSRNRCSKNCA